MLLHVAQTTEFKSKQMTLPDVKGLSAGSPHLWSNDDAEFVVRRVSSNEEGVGPSLLQQIESRSLHALHSLLGHLTAGGGVQVSLCVASTGRSRLSKLKRSSLLLRQSHHDHFSLFRCEVKTRNPT